MYKLFTKNERLFYNKMHMRKLVVFLLSVLLFVSLLSFAFSTSSNIAFTHPSKIKSWLNQSNLYGNFVADAIKQAEKTTGGDSSSISLNDAAVQQIAQSTFTSRSLQGNVNTFVDSNYAWLEGKSNAPNFRIDLTDAKQTFAEKVGDYVQTYLKNLPVCSDTQTLQLSSQTNDPLTLPCRPIGLIPATVAAQVTDEITNSGGFLTDPVITASNIDPKGDSESQPYYQNLSGLPKVYQLGTKLPWIAGVVALASMVGVIFISKRHRNGVRNVGIVLLLAGLVLIVTKFLSDQIFNKVHHHVFNNTDVGQLQKALTVFMHHAEDQLVKVDLWFGITYLVLAAGILITLRSTRQRRQTAPSFLTSEPKAPSAQPKSAPAPPIDTGNMKVSRNGNAAKISSPKPPRRKPPRLVQ
jgi:hypothetical protein